ncbi:MAG: ATP-dependent zinc metalloprotease FtsH [Candidatus Midichloria mitochondrii]|uniref:ATP-dependent zinc metalloprotease FtsH n=1 Tax=Midichloria mitochondrii (strain IricVA) TaxID=696127 RepID=F7XVH3_MIDMI|nr:ATP-dependent zinc metalloprotease FtsH [Candidatus Midichloria mitochondrii]AEI88672.1 cell division protease FtsH [Candidatus Midichloria mitochondrii IricVA]MDJ1256560.1 ATP-dependent zinc metalloprotease FtsH [Candidatus Midichloria mitochondrii]MDJ1288263.1 ATP-dependent zinc metalloprotease FtsH [Candidatus Midichloria mitochondrii]MDJ1299138.1 ATP-dependent zinc metalloprotease FtsH [Candidatus Midichloria mitochondrii]MDJ1313276.1 ATP-dependent zinc metalloprotease FtsH [Candidatus 
MKQLKGGNNFTIWIAIVGVLIIVYNMLGDINLTAKKVIFSEFLDQIDSGSVKSVTIRGDLVEGKYTEGGSFVTLIPRYYPNLIEKMKVKEVAIDIAPLETSFGNLVALLSSWFPVILLIGVWVYFMKNMQSGGGKALGFGRSKARLVSDPNKVVTFADVAGVDEAKEELVEIVDFLKNPGKFQKLGGKIPRGCLLVGSPGTGKTLLARAVAGEAGVPFFTISGSDFVEMFVGVGASRVRDMFAQAKKQSPCIVFIDEIDAVGRHRGAGLGGGNDEREQTLNQLLVEMDGFSDNEGVIVMAATNRPDVLDPALLRPGRFDRQIVVPIPDIKGREQILAVHAKAVPIAPDVDIRVLARGTPGFSGADLKNLINEAALMAARRDRNMVSMQEMEFAKDKVMMGAERKSLVMTDDDKKLTAYHEAGHALVALHLPDSDPLHKATIIPRGRALGVTMRLPESDRLSMTKAKLKADLAVAMGGRVAEEIVFSLDKITTGAGNDIKVATQIARKMVTQWGLSDSIGPVLVGDDKEEVFLGHSIGRSNHISNELATKIDEEIKKIIDEAYNTAKAILTKHRDQLEDIAQGLLEYEVLSGQEMQDLINGKPTIRKEDENKKAANKPSVSIPKAGSEPKPVKPKLKESSGIQEA